MPKDVKGMRTLFNAFHHFRPDEARLILKSAVTDRSSIAIFELVGREPATLIGMLFSWLGVLLVMPFVRPVRLRWLFFTYVVPVIPLLVLWDGLVSCLRVYSVDAWAEALRGVCPTEGPVDRPWGHRYLWLRDPDHVRIALFEGKV